MAEFRRWRDVRAKNQQIYLVQNAPGDLASGEPTPITSGAAWSAQASIAQGRMAFQSGSPEVTLWRLPADAGTLHQVTRLDGRYGRVNNVFAVDNRCADIAWREDEGDIWVMDVAPR